MMFLPFELVLFIKAIQTATLLACLCGVILDKLEYKS